MFRKLATFVAALLCAAAVHAGPPTIIHFNDSGALEVKRGLGGVVPVATPTAPVTTMRPFRWKIRNDLFPEPTPGTSFADEYVAPWNPSPGFFDAWPGVQSPVPEGTQGWVLLADQASHDCHSSAPYCYEIGPINWSAGGANTGRMIAGRNSGTIRFFCDFSHFAYDDPLVFPGQPGKSHLHAFFGNTKTGASTTSDTIANEGNSTCSGGTDNRTGYWVPAMIYHCPAAGVPTGCDLSLDGTPIVPAFLNVYYKANFGFGEFDGNGSDYWIFHNDIQVFPAGMRIIAGHPTDTPSSAHVENDGAPAYTCRNGAGADTKNTQYFLEGTGAAGSGSVCPSGTTILIQNVSFQPCWNGVDLDSPGHNAHVTAANFFYTGSAAVTHGGGRACPTTHPYQIPGIAFLVQYDIGNGQPGHALADMKFWRLASDNYDDSLPSGYSGHGDWMNGWDQSVLTYWITNILRPGLGGTDDVLGPILGSSPDTRGPPFNGWRVLRQPKIFRSNHQGG